jgi:drug/metabolite transporter (DMT)-like permease
MNTRLKADLALAACMFMWGATFVLVQNALTYASVFAFLSVRFVLAALVMLAIYWKTVRGLERAEILAGSIIGIFLFAGYIFQTVALKFTTPSKAAFLNGSSAVLVPVLLAVFWRRRINRWAWAGALVAMFGLYFVAVPPSGFGNLNIGDLLSIGSAVMFAFHILAVAHYSTRHSIAGLTFLQIALTAALATIALPIVAAAGWEAPKFEITSGLIFAIVVTALGCTVLGFSAQLWAQKHTTANHAAILFTLEPVFAALTSYVVLHERLTHRTLAGAALIFAAILLAELKGPAPAPMDSTGPVAEPARSGE